MPCEPVSIVIFGPPGDKIGHGMRGRGRKRQAGCGFGRGRVWAGMASWRLVGRGDRWAGFGFGWRVAGALLPAICQPSPAKSLSMRSNHAVPLKYGRRRAATLLDVVSLLDRDLVGREENAKLPGFARTEDEKMIPAHIRLIFQVSHQLVVR